jgi:hypothetical protein
LEGHRRLLGCDQSARRGVKVVLVEKAATLAVVLAERAMIIMYIKSFV